MARLREPREQGSIIERIDIDDTPDLVVVSQRHGDIDAATTTNDLLRGLQTERVKLNLARLGSNQPHVSLRIRKRSGIVLAAK